MPFSRFQQAADMTSKIYTIYLSIAAVGLLALPAHAASLFDRAKGPLGKMIDQAYGGGKSVAVNENTFVGFLVIVLNQLITFIGVIFFLLLIYAGYLWMTARGNDEQVSKAKKITRETVIGLIIVLLARLLTEFILSQIGTAVT